MVRHPSAAGRHRAPAAALSPLAAAFAVLFLVAGMVTVLLVHSKPASAATTGNTIIAAARSQLGKPYCFAGGNATGPTHGSGGSGCASKKMVGFDCSGLVLYAYARAGIHLNVHYTDNEYNEVLAMGGKVVPWAQAAPGALILFHSTGDSPAYFHHIAIYTGNGMLIEASNFNEPLAERPIYPDDKVVFVQPPQLNYWHGDDWFASHQNGRFLLTNTLGNPLLKSFTTGWYDDIPLSGDWDGNGTDTTGYYAKSTSTFYLSNSLGGGARYAWKFGITGDIPIVGDWNGDGIDTVGVYRQSTGTFYLATRNGSTALAKVVWGTPGLYEPVAGDWDGNGTTTLGLRLAGTARYYISNTLSGAHSTAFTYGVASDVPVVGDWDNKQGDSLGVFRAATHVFYLRNGISGPNWKAVSYGSKTDLPLVGDWDGNGTTTLGVIRPS